MNRIRGIFQELEYLLNRGIQIPRLELSQKTKRDYAFIVVQFFFVIYIESLDRDKLKLIGYFLSDDFNKLLLGSPRYVAVSLALAAIFLSFRFEGRNSKRSKRETYNRLCKSIFKNFIDKERWPVEVKQSFRVSFMMPVRKLSYNKLHKRWWTGNFGRDTHLEVCGRYISTEGKFTSKFYCKPGQGAAGFCYSRRIVCEETLCSFEDDPRGYLERSELIGLSKAQVHHLNRKAVYYFCIPISHYNDEKVFGVVSIDSIANQPLSDELKYDVESFVTKLNYLFINNRIP